MKTDLIPYAGITASQDRKFQFRVTGSNSVLPMLTYDNGIVNGEIITVRKWICGDVDLSVYTYTILSTKFTPKRWMSYGFKVSPDFEIIEVI